MSKKVFDVVAIVGKRKDNGKPVYQNCGVVLEGDKGLSMKLTALPISQEWSGWFQFYEPKPRGDSETYKKPADAPSESPADDFGDSPIPF